MDKYKNGHYSSYLDNIPRTWTAKNGHYSSYLDNIPRTCLTKEAKISTPRKLVLLQYLGHGQVRMVTIAILTIHVYLGHGQVIMDNL